jgi:hypothetical protein
VSEVCSKCGDIIECPSCYPGEQGHIDREIARQLMVEGGRAVLEAITCGWKWDQKEMAIEANRMVQAYGKAPIGVRFFKEAKP